MVQVQDSVLEQFHLCTKKNNTAYSLHLYIYSNVIQYSDLRNNLFLCIIIMLLFPQFVLEEVEVFLNISSCAQEGHYIFPSHSKVPAIY